MRFVVESSLAAHKREHLGIRPFPCSICRKGFARKNNRDAHEKTHKNVKLHKCDICCRMFKYQKQLRSHRRAHLEADRCLLCKYCQKAFQQTSALKRHITVEHAEIKGQMTDEEFREVISEALNLHHKLEEDEITVS